MLAGAQLLGSPPAATNLNDYLLVPLRVHLLSAKESPDISTTLTNGNITRILGKVNRVWAQAGLHFYLESLAQEEAANPELFLAHEGPAERFALLSLRPEETKASNLFHVYYLKQMTVNGIFLGEAIFVKDTASLREVEGGMDEPLPRVTAHELGHAFGLAHRQDKTNLMASGTTGIWLNEGEARQVRERAKQFPWIEPAGAVRQKADEWARTGKAREAEALYQRLAALATAANVPPTESKREFQANQMIELSFASTKTYADPFNDVELDVSFTAADGETLRVPAFWAGEQTWKARYASGKIGIHRYRTECSDKTNRSLHDREGVIEVTAYTGDNPFYRHGPVRVAADKKHFEYADGKPFLWLADTWWMGLCKRLSWPDDFKTLTADRVEKGFNVVQIVAGLYPDMPAFDERGANEVGFPWTTNYSRINPEYFDAADARIRWLVESGIAPCIVGAWGYHLPWLGVERMKKHWRYLVARYGAYPVFWCVAGEGMMPYYLSQTKSEDAAFQKKGWTEVAAYLRGIDPFHHPISIHPTDMARRQLEDAGLLDFDMLQTGHSDRASIPNTLDLVRASRAAAPPMPTINAEVCYEGILDTCFQDVQRFMVWSCLLSGTAGHTYGANGIWQVNRRDQPYGKSPHGGNWGNTSWDDAMRLPGSWQVGLAKKFLERLGSWWELEPHPDWVTVDATGPTVQWGDWIWFPEGDPAKDAPVAKRYFRKTLEIPVGERIASATLSLSADDKFTAFVNGRKVGSNRDWQHPRSYQVAPHLQAGRNVLAVEAENVKAPVELNPAGLLCGLEIHFAGGDKMEVLSDATWRCARKETADWTTPGFDDGNWSAVKVIGKYGDPPWGRLDAGDRYWMPYVAGARERNAVVIYLPLAQKITVHHLNPAEDYRAEFFNPVSGAATQIGFVRHLTNWAAPACPDESHDWVLYLLARKGTK